VPTACKPSYPSCEANFSTLMGNVFSGWFGRRSSRPFFDELPRITIADCNQNEAGLAYFSCKGQTFTVRKIIVPIGCMAVPRLICARCGRTCRVLYLCGKARCYRCTGARYRTASESPSRRALRRAKKIFIKHAVALDYKRPQAKPAWMRWPTFEKLSAEADAVWPIIEADENALYDAINKLESKLDTPKRKRGRPPIG
jgi:hypothetical protein